jgi:hypothetical protein
MEKKTAAALVALALVICFGGLQVPLQAQTTVTGTLKFNFSLDIYAGPSATPSCTGTATVNDTGSGAVISESATADANGPYSNATCTVSIHYTWHLTSPGQDKITLSYSASAPIPVGTNGSTETRTSQVQNFVTISVPANGTTTTENINLVMNGQ